MENPKDDTALNAAREWLAAEPPGLDRADKLAIPRLPSRLPHSAFRNWIWHTAVAAAIFVGGFFIGRIDRTTINRASTTPSAPVAVHSTPIPTPSPKPDTSPQLAKSTEPPQRYVTQRDGRVIIETTLADSGAHATWVIDGSFKLASNETNAH